jgi:hypothetical protein
MEGGAHADWTSAEAFWTENQNELIRASLADAKRVFTDAGFVAGIGQRWIGKKRTAGELPGLTVVVLRFGSEQGAKDASKWRHDDTLKPCPRKCDVSISEFDAGGIADSSGVKRSVSQASIDVTGDKNERPYDSYEVLFVDHEFVYVIASNGAPGSVTESGTVSVAKALDERVRGAPAPS